MRMGHFGANKLLNHKLCNFCFKENQKELSYVGKQKIRLNAKPLVIQRHLTKYYLRSGGYVCGLDKPFELGFWREVFIFCNGNGYGKWHWAWIGYTYCFEPLSFMFIYFTRRDMHCSKIKLDQSITDLDHNVNHQIHKIEDHTMPVRFWSTFGSSVQIGFGQAFRFPTKFMSFTCIC